MLLRDLLDIPELRLTARCGSGSLGRPIRWVYTTEIVEPGRYLSGGELVITGLMWMTAQDGAGFVPARRTPEEFVATLVDAGVAALAVGTAVHGHVPPEILAACRAQGLPLIEIPAEVSFGTVSEVVTRRLTGEKSAVLGRRRRLMAAVAGGAGLPEVFALAGEELGAACRVVSASGRVVAGAGLEPAAARELAAAFLTAERLPCEAGGHLLVPVGGGAGHRVSAWFIACERAPDVEETAFELAALAALERGRREEGLRVERRLVAELVELAARADPAEVLARMRTCGLPPSVPYAAVAASVQDTARPGEVACAVLEEVLAAGPRRLPGVVGVVDAEAVALVPVPDGTLPELVARLREGATRLAPALSRPGKLTAGVSGTALGPGGLAGAVDEARHTRRLAGLRPGRTQVVTSDEIHSYVLLLATVPEGVRRSFRDRLLRPLHEYDAEHHSDLVHTLETFLACSGSWNRSAAELHVHVNTLRYRVRRIEELTGRDLGTLEDRVDFFLALRST